MILSSRLPDNLYLRRVEPAEPGARSADEERSVRSGEQHDAAHRQKEPVNFVCESENYFATCSSGVVSGFKIGVSR